MEAVTSTANPPARPGPDVRVLVVGDHPALRAGLELLFAREPGLDCVGTVAGTRHLVETVRDTRPDVVVLDHALGADDGLTTCFRLKQRPSPPRVVLYSTDVHRGFAVPAAIAQADATVAKSASVTELLSTVRGLPGGPPPGSGLDPELVEAAAARLLADDLPIAGMLLAGTPVSDIAEVLDMSATDVRNRALRIIGRLQAGSRSRSSGGPADPGPVT
ncbi:MAG: hypothetical protein QOG77_3702 [Solirubrobacteraceae bacterium]|jgi:DNA-binding NarL/FixJ family response regulator|nr:hypothetical protein [Solirubrobacteraceae bacterium]